MPTAFEQLLQQALALHQQGQFVEAEAIYRRVLASEPNNAIALCICWG